MAAVALWPTRWPAIAKQECIDTVNAAPPEERSMVKFDLPCQDCEKNTACLNAKRKELGPLLYAREILTKPSSSESTLLPRELFEPGLLKRESFVPYWHKPYSVESRYAVASAWDLAWSEKVGGDWLVKMTAVLDRQTGKRKILDIGRWQKLTFTQQIDLMQAEWARYHDDLVVIESDAAQRIWSQYVEEHTPIPVLPHGAGGKGDLQFGVPGLIMQLEAKLWEIPFEMGSYHHENAEIFLSECEAFNWVDGKLQGVGEHDDTVMAWYHLAWAMDLLVADTPSTKRRGRSTGAQI